MSEKLTTDETIRLALLDAADWQRSLADSYPAGDPYRQRAFDRVAAYMRVYNRRYGRDTRNDVFENAKSIDISEIGKPHD